MTGFLFGKLPAFGDFVSRGLSAPMHSWWDSWCSTAMLEAKQQLGDDFDLCYRTTRARCFLNPPPVAGAPWQVGCVLPSHDRAGRAFPFVIGISSPVPLEASGGAAMGMRIAACLGPVDQQADLDALVLAAAATASDTFLAARAIPLPSLWETGWFGEKSHSVES